MQRQHIGDRLSGVLLRQGVIAFREQPTIETFLYFTNPCHMECMEYPSFNAHVQSCKGIALFPLLVVSPLSISRCASWRNLNGVADGLCAGQRLASLAAGL